MPAGAIVTATVTAVLSVAAVFAISALVSQEPGEHGGTPSAFACAATIGVVVAQSMVLAWPRRLPDAGVLFAAGLPVVLALIAPGVLYTVTAFPVVVAAFLVGLRTGWGSGRWRLVLAAALVAAGQSVNVLSEGRTDHIGVLMEAMLQAVIVVGVPLIPAGVIAAHRATRAAQDETIAALARERDAVVGRAIATERAAMARELHDIAAHHLSGISVMASAVAKQATTNPDAARAGAFTIREQSNSVLDDLRRLVGLLRSTGPVDEAVKTLATVSSLVDGARAIGQPATMVLIEGGGRELGEGVGPLGQLAAYRMVQESLSNASRYAPGARVTVTIDDTDPHRLRLTVHNTRPPAPARPVSGGTGLGLIGMQERATLTGGTFHAGPAGDNGWEVRMSVPRDTPTMDRSEPLS